MSVVHAAFGREVDRRPHLLTVFCVQSFWRDRDRLVKGRFEQFTSLEAAMRAGKLAEQRAPAVLLFRVRGNVEAQHWEEPVTVARLGVDRAELPPPPAPGRR